MKSFTFHPATGLYLNREKEQFEFWHVEDNIIGNEIDHTEILAGSITCTCKKEQLVKWLCAIFNLPKEVSERILQTIKGMEALWHAILSDELEDEFEDPGFN